jgi:amidase
MIPITAAVLDDAAFQALSKRADATSAEEPGEMERDLRSIGLRHRDWLLLHEERERQRALWADFFRRFDVLLCPVAAVVAIRHDHAHPLHLRKLEVNGAERPYTDLFAWTGPIGAAHLPASVAPVGRTQAGLPVGIQIVAPYLEDRTSLAFRGAARVAARGIRATGGSRRAGLTIWGGAPP